LVYIGIFSFFLIWASFLRVRYSRQKKHAMVISEFETEISNYKTSKTETSKARLIKKLAVSEAIENNITHPVRIAHVEAKMFNIFNDCDWILQPGVNFLLGRNGYGKTYFLRALITAIAQDEKAAESLMPAKSSDAAFSVSFQRVTDEGNDNQLLIKDKPETQDDAGSDELRSSLEAPGIVVGEIGKVPVLAIPDARFINKSRRNFTPPDEASNLKMHGGLQFARQEPYEDIVQSFLYEIAIDSLKKDGDISKLPVGQLIQGIVRELTGTEFQFHSVDHGSGSGLRIMVEFESGQMDPVPLQAASQGTLSILAIFGLIWSFLKSLYGEFDKEELPDLSAIVIIDEVDAHLHPVWQQRIVGLLRRTFPSVQFILTAHSPLVVAGCLKGEVSILRRKAETSELEICTVHHDFIGRDVEEINRTVFEIEEFDETFQDYQTKRLEKRSMEKRLTKLKDQKRLSRSDRLMLKRLEDDLYYLKKTEERSEQISREKLDKAEMERRRTENEFLKRKIESLERKIDGKKRRNLKTRANTKTPNKDNRA